MFEGGTERTYGYTYSGESADTTYFVTFEARGAHELMFEKYEEPFDDSFVEDYVEPMLRNDLGMEDEWEIADSCDVARRLARRDHEREQHERVYARQAV